MHVPLATDAQLNSWGCVRGEQLCLDFDFDSSQDQLAGAAMLCVNDSLKIHYSTVAFKITGVHEGRVYLTVPTVTSRILECGWH